MLPLKKQIFWYKYFRFTLSSYRTDTSLWTSLDSLQPLHLFTYHEDFFTQNVSNKFQDPSTTTFQCLLFCMAWKYKMKYRCFFLLKCFCSQSSLKWFNMSNLLCFHFASYPSAVYIFWTLYKAVLLQNVLRTFKTSNF